MNTILTLDEHRQLALLLHEMRNRVSGIVKITSPKLPKRSRASENLWRLTRTLDQIKTLLDSALCEQHPDAPYPSPYYSNGREMPGVSDAR